MEKNSSSSSRPLSKPLPKKKKKRWECQSVQCHAVSVGKSDWEDLLASVARSLYSIHDQLPGRPASVGTFQDTFHPSSSHSSIGETQTQLSPEPVRSGMTTMMTMTNGAEDVDGKNCPSQKPAA